MKESLPLWRLLELEQRLARRAVIELQDQLATRVLPRFLGFPDILVLIRRGVVAEAARARRDGFFDGVGRRAAAARDLLRGREATYGASTAC